MRDEDAFNAYLSKQLGKLGPRVAKLKMAEKYHIGIPDFCLWAGGRSVVFESKFLPTLGLPASKASVLKHPFTGPQQTFLHTLMRAGVPAFGLIGIGDVGQMILVPANLIPASGSWTVGQLVSLSGEPAPMFNIKDVSAMVSHMFSYFVVGGVCRRSERNLQTQP